MTEMTDGGNPYRPLPVEGLGAGDQEDLPDIYAQAAEVDEDPIRYEQPAHSTEVSPSAEDIDQHHDTSDRDTGAVDQEALARNALAAAMQDPDETGERLRVTGEQKTPPAHAEEADAGHERGVAVAVRAEETAADDSVGASGEINVANMLQETERTGIRTAAAALNKAGSKADRSAGLAAVRGMTLAARYMEEVGADSENLSEDSPDGEEVAVQGNTAAQPAGFSLNELTTFADKEVISQPTAVQSRPPTTTTPDTATNPARTKAAEQEMYRMAGAKDLHAQRALERRLHGAPPLEPTESQTTLVYNRTLRQLRSDKPPTKTKNHVAAGMTAVLELRRMFAQKRRDWEHRWDPTLPETIRPDDVDPWERDHIIGVTKATLPGATDIDAAAAADGFAQKRFAEQYTWDWQYDPPKNGLILPQRPRPLSLTENQAASMYDVLVRSGAPNFVAQAAVDTQRQQIADEMYTWLLELFRLQYHPRADTLPIIPPPHPYTAAQMATEQSQFYEQLGDMAAARAQVDSLLSERRQRIFYWNRDFAILNGVQVEVNLDGVILNAEKFSSMKGDQQARLLDVLAEKLAENSRRPGGAKQTEEWRLLGEQFIEYQLLHISPDTDASGRSLNRAIEARAAAGRIIPGYNADPRIRTAVVFNGSRPDTTSALCVTIAGCEQVFTVGTHNSEAVDKALSRDLGASMQRAIPHLDNRILADVVVVSPSADYVDPSHLPSMRPRAVLIVSGSSRGLIQQLAEAMQDGQTAFQQVQALPEGTIEVNAQGDPIPGLQAAGGIGAIFIKQS